MKPKKLFGIVMLSVAALAVSAAFVACKPTDEPVIDPGKRPIATVEQDLSMFDTVMHYGIAQVETYSLTIVGENASFTGGVKTINIAEKALLPVVVVEEGEYIVGIKNVKTDKVIEDFRFRMPAEDTEIEVITSTEKPVYFKELTLGMYFDYNSSGNDLDWDQVVNTFEPNGPFTMNTEYSIESKKQGVDVNGNTDDDYLRGSMFEISGVAGNATRILTFSGAAETDGAIKGGERYTFVYNFQNFGEHTISFRMYQAHTTVKLGVTHRPKASAVNAGRDITLEPGESVSYNITFTPKDDDTNIIPVLELRSDFDGDKLGIAIAKKNEPLECEHDIKLVEATEGDCGKAGNIAYYGCAKCGGMWSDETGETEASMLDVTVKHEHTAGDCVGANELAHRMRCSVCGGVYIASEAHNLVYRVVKEPTADELGVKEEVCSVCGYKTGNTIEYQDAYTFTVKGDTDTEFRIKVDAALPDEVKELLTDKFYNVDDLTEIFDKSTFTMPERNISVKSFDAAKGNALAPANATTGGGFQSNTGWGNMSTGIADLNYKKASAVKTEGGKAILGGEISMKMRGETATVRLDSQYNAENTAIQVDRFIYEVTVENRGDVAITFDITQVNGGAYPINGVSKFDNVVLAAGASKDFTFIFPGDVGSNSNALTAFWFKNMTTDQTVTIGLAVSYREYDIEHTLTYGDKTFSVIGGKAPSDEIKEQLPEEFYAEGAPSVIYSRDSFVMPYGNITIKVLEKQKFTFDGKTYDVKAGDQLPDEAKAALNAEFYNVNNTSEIFAKDAFRMPAYDLTVKNIETPVGNIICDYGTTWWVSGEQTNTNGGVCAVKKENGDALKGLSLVFRNGANRQARVAQAYDNGNSVKLAGAVFHITIENRGSETVTFGIAQINGGANKIAGCYDDNVTLTAGQSKEFTFTFPTSDPNMGNGNALTLFSFGSDVPAEITLGMALSVELAA